MGIERRSRAHRSAGADAKRIDFSHAPSLGHYIITSEDLQRRMGAVFAMIREGKLKLRIEHVYPLAEAQQAHRDLEGRKTTGKLLLIPN